MGGGGSDPRQLKNANFFLIKKAGRFEMKNCIIFFKVRQSSPVAVLFWCISKSVLSSFRFQLYMIFFQGTFLFFLLKPFPMSEFAGFKNIYVYIKKKCIIRYCSDNS